ncbi:hypothetical protein D1646_13020 [Pseudoflavonifractor sp. 60]|uniref:hypothetical protein n=1 Tax=Pseudoflavonifractor sp. 60 TaxID=2304576 RepID=UPI00136FD368|nr:hypothetical protein [Pseudoflavonifractor sp. 60]NBI67705.1 hypothetical protein [Pseudoflavonifractor sp. 60]
MPDLLGVTNPVPGHNDNNVNRNIPTSPSDTRVQNAPDLNRVSRSDNRTERQDTGDSGGSQALRYDSNFAAFLQRLMGTPGMAESMSRLFAIYQGLVVSSGIEEGTAQEMGALLNMLKMDQSQLGKFLLSQMSTGTRFGGALFAILRDAYSASNSETTRGNILQFLKKYSDYTSTSHLQGNMLRGLTKLTRAIPASWGSQLLPMVSELEGKLNAGDRQGALKLLQGTIMPFLSGYTSKTNDMGLSRTLISMLALDISRYENGSEDGLLQAFHQLGSSPGLKERLGGLTDEALLRLVNSNSFARAAEGDQFAAKLAQAAHRALQGGAGQEVQEAFRNIVSAFLVNESVHMPLNHILLPLEWDGKMVFSEMWVDPDAEENLKRGRGNQENTLRFLFKIDIQGLGFFDMVMTCQGERVDIQLFCPDRVAPFSQLVQGELSRILTDNGLTAGSVQVQRSDRPLTISGVFPKIFEGESSINVKI